MRRATLILAAIAVALAGVVVGVQAPPAQAHDHLVPQTVLKKGARELQTGRRVVESSWSHPAGDNECVQESAIYTVGFREADRVSVGSELRVRIFKKQRPDAFEVTAYKRVDQNGHPAGDGRPLGTSLVPVVEDGRRVAWDAVFHVNRPDRDYYLITEGHWQDRQGCGGDQYAYWSFHVMTGGS